jgi:hypothetical protein
MTEWIRQSTAVTKKMGPFVDDTDGVTPETGLAISQADIRLSKNGGNFAQTNNAAGGTHDENGYYGIPLDTTDTATLGSLRVAINESGALPVWQDFMVVPANVWDSYFASDALQVHVTEMATNVITATTIAGGAIGNTEMAADAIDASALADTAIQEIRNAITGGAYALDTDANGRVRVVDGTGAGELDTDSGTVLLRAATETQIDDIESDVTAILADTGTDGVVLANDSITAAKIATDAIGSDELAIAGCNKIADHTLRRSFQSAIDSSDGDAKSFRSPLGAIAKLVNRVLSSGGVLSVYEDDDVTVLGTQNVSTDAAANPITELDTV